MEVVIGSVFLGIALVPTLMVVATILKIIAVANAILRLARTTLPAAQGIVVNTAAIPNKCPTTEAVVRKILATAQAIDGVAGTIAGKLRALASAVERRGS